MNNLKGRKAQNSPVCTRPANTKSLRLTFDVNPRKLECFLHPKPQKPAPSKPHKLKSTSLTNPRQQSCGKNADSKGNTDNPTEKANQRDFLKQSVMTERISKAADGKQEPRKTAVGNSPDIAKAIMNEVLHKIQKEGITSQWHDDDPRKQDSDSHSDNQKQGPSAEVTLIWSRQSSLPALSDKNDKSFFSNTESGSLQNQNYLQYQPHLMQPHFFTQHYPFEESQYQEGPYQEVPYQEYYRVRPEEVNTKRVFEIAYETIERDGRTTIMIKNIPNKYSLKLLSDEIDEKHADRYDFLYLPFDFNNNCNVGYAFINFLCPEYLRMFYEQFHNKRWAKFRSEKICVLTYARLQGRQSLIEHFHNSKVLNQKDKKFRPIIRDLSKLSDLLQRQRNSKV